MTDAALTDPWLAVAIGAFVLAVLTVALFARRERRPAASTDAKLDALGTRMEAVEAKWKETDHDIRAVRMVVGSLPTAESMNAIAIQVAETRGKMDGMQATLHSQTKSLDRIEDWLMKTSAEAIVGSKAARSGNGGEE